jgi:Ca2+-binding RTX toxin-like protein
MVETTSPTNGGAQIKWGGSGGDVIVASDKVIFDWVPAAGNSNQWSETFDGSEYVWDEQYQEYVYQDYSWTNQGSSPSTASGSVAFDTPIHGQTFLEAPVEFMFSNSQEGRPWTETLASLDYPSQWIWNPDTGKLDPNYAGTSLDHHNSFMYFDPDEVTSTFNHTTVVYDYSSYQSEAGHWAVRPTGDLTAFGGAGNDRIHGGTGNDRLFGEAGDDEIHGGLGPSYLSGGQGKDILIAGVGQQTLDGGSGNDTLVDGAGNTIMIGGSGADTFVFKPVSGGSDKILDFKPSYDHIRLDAILGLTSAEAVLARSTDLGGSTLIALADDHTVLLMGTDLAHLTARSDAVFLFA